MRQCSESSPCFGSPDIVNPCITLTHDSWYQRGSSGVRRLPLSRLYTNDAAVQAALMGVMPVLAAMLFGDALNCVYSGAAVRLMPAWADSLRCCT